MQRLRLVSSFGWGFPTWDEEEAAALSVSFGLGYVQLFRTMARPVRAADIRRALEGHGLKIVSLHAFFGDLHDPSLPDESARQRAVENLAREADFCLNLGGSLIVVHPGDANIGEATRDPRREAALHKSAESLAAIGQERGVTIALENLQPGQMGSDMAVLRRVVDAVDSPRLGLNFDCGHANLTDGPLTVLEQGGPRIVGTHIHDNAGASDDHLVPGSGSIDMDAVCRALARFKYRGDFVLEPMETTEVLRTKCDAAWQARLMRWVDLASGIIP